VKGYLLDTNIAIALWDKLHPSHTIALDFFEKLGDKLDDKLWISVIVLGEVAYGYEVHEEVDFERKRIIQSQMKTYIPEQLLTISRHTAKEYGKIRAELFKRYAEISKRGLIKTKRPETLIDETTSTSST